MSRFLKGMTYGFGRNLGKKDRIIRAVIALGVLASWYFGVITGTIGIILGVLAIMVLGTAAVARCSICYIADISTISKEEGEELQVKGIKYEK